MPAGAGLMPDDPTLQPAQDAMQSEGPAATPVIEIEVASIEFPARVNTGNAS